MSSAYSGRKPVSAGRAASNIGPVGGGSAPRGAGIADRMSMLIALLLALVVALAVVGAGRLRAAWVRGRRPAVDGGSRRDFFGDRLVDPTNG
jgi:hypothetical protein